MSKFTDLKVYSNKKTINSAPFSKRERDMFCWGRIIEIHKIGDIEIIEYLPLSIGTSELSIVHHFHVNGISHTYQTLDLAIIGAIAVKYDGWDTQAGRFFTRAVKMPMSF